MDEQTNLVEDELDGDSQYKHRCSMIKRYQMPTFFGACNDKKRFMTPSKPSAASLISKNGMKHKHSYSELKNGKMAAPTL